MTGKRLRGLRRSKKISQTEMAEILGVHKNTYAMWEKNPAKMSVKWLPPIAKALDTDPYELFRIMMKD